jgi:predicted small metal-binding protein
VTLERVPHGDDYLTGRCGWCGWSTITEAYPDLVKRYQDHLRDEHPTRWLRD